MIREGGTFMKLLDLLDERKLNALEARLLAGHFLQLEDQPSLPVSDMNQFNKKAEEHVRKMAPVYDPLQHRMRPCIDTRKLYRATKTHRGIQGFLHRLCPCAGSRQGAVRRALIN